MAVGEGVEAPVNNCYSGASSQNSDNAVCFGDPNDLYDSHIWRSAGARQRFGHILLRTRSEEARYLKQYNLNMLLYSATGGWSKSLRWSCGNSS